VKADPKYKYVGMQYDQDNASIAAQVTSRRCSRTPASSASSTNLFRPGGAATGIRQV
jgi:hypothetical protein